MQHLDYLCDVIGPRLTASPAQKRAGQWAIDKMTSWGMTNGHLESWGPFGRGWTVKRFSLQVTEPVSFPLRGFPKGWSPGFDKPFEASIICLDNATTAADLEKFRGQLKGQIVVVGTPRSINAVFQPLAARYDEQELARSEAYAANSQLQAGRLVLQGARGGA